jgi:hypothetical protein
MVVASPVRLIGAERTFMGDSDDESFGPKDYKLEKRIDPLEKEEKWLLPGIRLSKGEDELLQRYGEVLDEHSEFDIKDVRTPSTIEVDPSDDERGRWDIMETDGKRLGTVVRLGDGSKKRYIMHLWDGKFYRVDGQPPYDIPMFGLPALRAEEHKPIMIHEGPKAWMGAVVKSQHGNTLLEEWLNLFVHVSWHGSDTGMEWTDWSPLRGRRVIIWPDMDKAGLRNARELARKLAFMGGVIEIVTWGEDDISRSERWDWGDPLVGYPATLTRTDIKKRIVRVESPVDSMGRLLHEFLERSVYDPVKNEIYMESMDYRPMPLSNLAIGKGKTFQASIVDSPIHRYAGITYEPGREFGILKSGKINVCRENIRNGVRPAPLDPDIAREIMKKWLCRMIPNRRDRMYLIRKAALAIVKPERVSQHISILQGGSGIGKSVLLDLIVAVAGEDRATSLFPSSATGRFNARIARKSIVCIHEIHAIEGTKRQQEGRFKELMGNSTIEVEDKNVSIASFKNVINWFAATNEKTPFVLENGNNRNYFIQCASPLDARDTRERDRFFKNWIDRFKEDEEFLDQLYAAALWMVERMSDTVEADLLGRAKKQSIWEEMKEIVLRPWQQFVVSTLEGLPYDEGLVMFAGMDMARLTARDYKTTGVSDVLRFMRERGYEALVNERGARCRKSVIEKGPKEYMWSRAEDRGRLIQLWEKGSLPRPVSLTSAT